MTEQTMPVGGTAVAEPPAPVLPEGSVEGNDSANRRNLMIVGAVVGVLVLAVAAWFLMKGGSSTPAASSNPVQLPAPTVTHHKAATANKPVKLPKVYKGHVGRDPFKPLYTAPTAAPAPPPGSGTSGSTSGSTDGTGTTPTTGTSSPPTTTTPKTPVYRPVWLQLHSLTAKTATFDIGYSDRHNLRVARVRVAIPTGKTGTVFAKDFMLVRAVKGGVEVKFGDGSTFLLDQQHPTMIVN